MNTAKQLLFSFINGSAFPKNYTKAFIIEDGEVKEVAETEQFQKKLAAQYFTNYYNEKNRITE